MALTDEEEHFLSAQRLGRLATVGPGGAPQVKPVGFRYNPELGTIDITGYNMAESAKYKNVQRNPLVAFVVDDSPGEGPEFERFLEIRGVAEAVPGIIRIHPRRVLSYNVDSAHPGFRARRVEAGDGPARPEVA